MSKWDRSSINKELKFSDGERVNISSDFDLVFDITDISRGDWMDLSVSVTILLLKKLNIF